MIVIDLPRPPSVNRMRRIDYAKIPRLERWRRAADSSVLVWRSKQRAVGARTTGVPGRFELHVTVGGTMDIDNGLKVLVDYLRRIELIQDDSPTYWRRLVVEHDAAIDGCRVKIMPIEAVA